MTSPWRGTWRACLAFLVTVAAVAAGFYVLPPAVAGGLAAVGVAVAVGSLGVGLHLFDKERKTARMRRGEGIIARWTIPAEDWTRFLDVARALDQQSRHAACPLNFKGEPPASGVEIAFIAEAVFVGNAYNSLEPAIFGTIATLHPSWMEFKLTGDDHTCVLRVPVPPGAHADAERVVRHFEANRADR